MTTDLSRRCFIKTTAAGLLCSGSLAGLTQLLHAATPACAKPASRVRIGRIYLGRERPGWPMHKVDLAQERQAFDAALAKLGNALDEYEFVDGGIISETAQLPEAFSKFSNVDGILAIQLSMGVGGIIQAVLEKQSPMLLFAPPYTGHEWHIVASLQRHGKLIESYPTSKVEDLPAALRPIRAIHRLKEARILHISTGPADPNYCSALNKKFGTEIISLKLEDLKAAYQKADRGEAMADARKWIREAGRIVEPTRQEIENASLMFIAMRDMLAEHGAVAVTMNCLGMRLMDVGMAYPCLGFVRLNNMGLGGVCEADIKSTMTHLIFSKLVGVPGFVTDPVFDLSNSTIIHAHCVAATQMEGPASKPAKYHIRSHLEDGRGVSLMVKMPVNRKLSMARLIGTDIMLFSTGQAVDSPFVDRGCRTKLTMKVDHIEKFLEGWSSGLHRVVFYGDHERDIRRYCRFAQIRLLHEGVDDLHNVEGLEWEPRVHA